MKRKYIISAFVLSILLFIGYYCFGWFMPYNWFTAKWDLAKGEIKWVEYGELDPYYKEKGSVGERFGFYIENVGCIVSVPLVNGIASYNHVVEQYLNEKVGTHWKHEFDSLLNQEIEFTLK